MKIIKVQGKAVPIHRYRCVLVHLKVTMRKSPWKIRLHLFNSSQMFWSEDLFTLLKIIADPKELLFMQIVPVNKYHIRN